MWEGPTRGEGLEDLLGLELTPECNIWCESTYILPCCCLAKQKGLQVDFLNSHQSLLTETQKFSVFLMHSEVISCWTALFSSTYHLCSCIVVVEVTSSTRKKPEKEEKGKITTFKHLYLTASLSCVCLLLQRSSVWPLDRLSPHKSVCSAPARKPDSDGYDFR